MIVDKYNIAILKIEDIYFANEINVSSADISRYIQFEGVSKSYHKNFITNIIDLNLSIDEIRKCFRKNVKSEINQAVKNHNITVKHYETPDDSTIENFCFFYNKMAKVKKISFANRKKIVRLKKNIIISKAIFEGTVIVWHLYLFDEERVRLLYSASLQNQDNEITKIISKANKLLHFEDIKYAKEKNLRIYDFGGISLINDEVAGIDQFKLAFSKDIKKYDNINIGNSWLGKAALLVQKLIGNFI